MRLCSVLRACGWLSVAGTTGCGPKDIVVARDQLSDGAAGRPCAGAADCNPEELCELTSCSSTLGQCVLRPAVCDDTQQIACGCDGVTYWNDCLRRRDGVSSSSSGQCVAAFASCSGAGAAGCPVADAVCGHLLPGSGPCPPNVPGVCWVVPDACPVDAGAPFWLGCEPPMPCLDLCTALRSEMPGTRAMGTACP